MSGVNYHIQNAKIINEGILCERDLYIIDGRIERIGGLSYKDKKFKEIDLKGRYLLPGMIDDQVHFREPGLTHKATIHSESKAAVVGGVTSFMEMPNTKPATVNYGELDRKYQIALQGCVANYGFYLGATHDNLDIIKNLKVGQVAGVKIFMGSSTGSMLVDDDKVLEEIFANAPTIIATHCEDDKRIRANEARFKKYFGEEVDFGMHPIIRDHKACINSTKKAIRLAQEQRAPLNVLHITTAKECQLFEQGNVDDKLITAEVCLHHLTFNSRDYAELGGLIKCNPAIKSEKDRLSIVEALSLDKLDIIATDHAPHTWGEKQQSYFKAPSGMPLLQDALPMALELVHDKALTLSELVTKCSHNVAKRYKVIERGYIREGYWADLVAIDFNKPYEVAQSQVLSACGWTPMNGRRLRSSVYCTWVSGNLVWYKNKLYDIQSKRLDFGRQR